MTGPEIDEATEIEKMDEYARMIEAINIVSMATCENLEDYRP